MIARQPVREAPFPTPLGMTPSVCHPDASGEDVLRIANIQGNIVAGFNKDFQTLLFLKITNADEFRRWLEELIPFVATGAEVLAFNRLFKAVRSRRHSDSRTVQATWMNLAISAAGLKKLAPGEAGKFRDAAFQAGLHARSRDLGDPQTGEGSPETWVVGGTPDSEADVVLIFAADDRDDLLAEVARIEDSIFAARTSDGRPLRCGVSIVYKQHGAVLPPPLTGHEHFGFLDGVSQPGLRGRFSEEAHDVVTLRQNPDDPDQGKPGQDLLWPGEFIFDYPGQDPQATEAEGGIKKKGPNSLRPKGELVAPEWARDGSYLVFRRLRQDVRGFRQFVQEKAAQLGITADLLGAKLVGRFRSGAPIMRTLTEDPPLGANDCRNNDFEFASDEEEAGGGGGGETAAASTQAATQADEDCLCERGPEAEPDDAGLVCPFAAHIRKTYPRNDRGTLAAGIGEVTTQTHRLLRRGIPFGPIFPQDPPAELRDSGDRGLLFLAYQTSIEEQFEFVQRSWANNPEFKDRSKHGELVSGHDFIIGQNGRDADRKRRFVLLLKQPDGSARREVLETTTDWVIPTGGGYFFAPSISALEQLARNDFGSGATAVSTEASRGGAAPPAPGGGYAAAMDVVVKAGTAAEEACRERAGLERRGIFRDEALAGGVLPTPEHDLRFRGGKTIARLTYRNLYVGGQAAWAASDRDNIDRALDGAMRDRRLNNVLVQYFNGGPISSTFAGRRILSGPAPRVVSRGDLEALVRALFNAGGFAGDDFGSTLFNFLLPRGTVLTTSDARSGGAVAPAAYEQEREPGDAGREGGEEPRRGEPIADLDEDEKASSRQGLGGFHGSVIIEGSPVYYAVAVFSEGNNGIDAFGVPWKNVVATAYHELCEARTDPDVEQANRTGDRRLIGWTSDQGEEIGDFPIFEDPGLDHVFKEVPLADGSGTVPIQLQYSNAVHGPEGPIEAPHRI